MKKIALISGMVFISFIFVFPNLYAQRINRNDFGIEDDYYDLNLTQEQLEQIDKLELELEKELSPLFSKLRSRYMELDDLEAQSNPNPTKINNLLDVIYKLEDDIQNKEILHEKKIKDLFTDNQRAIFDSYYGYCPNFYGRGDFGRGYFGRGLIRRRGGNYGYGHYGGSVGTGRNYLRRGAGIMDRGNYGFGRVNSRGYNINRGNFQPGAGRLSTPNNFRYYPRSRYGRGPCGFGLGKWYRTSYGRGR